MSIEKPPAPRRSNDPLHGITLEMMLTQLIDQYGWDGLGERTKIKCFTNDISFKGSLNFLRKTPWARSKVEELYKHSKF
ncbi:MAG: VF530 family protein [Gordonibacter sp.]|nr:VF530 family protein [Gordonibacter sp.]